MRRRPILLVIKGGRPSWKPYPRRLRSRWEQDRGDLPELEAEWRAMGLDPDVIARMRFWVSEIRRVAHLEVLPGRKRA